MVHLIDMKLMLLLDSLACDLCVHTIAYLRSDNAVDLGMQLC